MSEQRHVHALLAVIAAVLAGCGGGSTSGAVPGESSPVNALSPDPVEQLIYVSNLSDTNPNVAAYTASAGGTAAPTTVLAGSNTQIEDPAGIAFDSQGNMYVANASLSDDPDASCIKVFAPGANGNVAPIRSICGSNTQLSAPTGITLDAGNDLYVANLRGGPFPGNGNILEFAPGANGNVAPIAVIEGDKTGISIPYDVKFDALGELYVSNYYPGICGAQGSITIYAAGASGNAAPVRWISGPTSLLKLPQEIALDDMGNIYDANGSPEAVLVFAAGSNQDVAPIHQIGFGARAVAVDAAHDVYLNGVPALSGFPQGIEVYVQAGDGTYSLSRAIDDQLGVPDFLALH